MIINPLFFYDNNIDLSFSQMTHLESVIHNKDELMREIQQEHEESLDKLVTSTRQREEEWQNQRLQLEDNFSRQLGQLQSKSKVIVMNEGFVNQRCITRRQ